MRREWMKKHKPLRKKNKQKDMTVTKELALDIINQYFKENHDRIRFSTKENKRKKNTKNFHSTGARHSALRHTPGGETA
jgi:hypothetical protein